ncbi:SDR family oxidoreductase [Longibacter sp.]|jgi:uncharacterized protein YbjT (DUF2867 family)|uniref:SDR family oxidoreductase n=1 Tax=Longibacter sp. TaxID=2045415 RepID=UPI003EB9AF71
MSNTSAGLQRILVTGATGTVGREVIARLCEAGQPLTAAVRNPRTADVGPGVPTVQFDFERPSTYGPAFAGHDALFLVRPPAITRVWSSIFPAIDAAVRAGVWHIVFLSLQGAEANPLVPHRWIEWKLASTDVTATLLRPSFFMQNLVTTHRREIGRDGRIVVPAGAGRTAFIDARDIAAVAARVLIEPRYAGRAFELTGPAALTYHEVADVLSEVLGRTIRYDEPGLLDFLRHSRREGRPWPFILVMTGIYLTARFGGAARTTSTVASVLERPARSFRHFAEDYATAWARAS